MQVCARPYFERLLEEAKKKREEMERKRHDSDMRIMAWRAEVYEAVLRYCVAGLCLEDVGLAIVEALLRNDYNFTYERGRKLVAQQFVEVLIIPAHVECV